MAYRALFVCVLLLGCHGDPCGSLETDTQLAGVNGFTGIQVNIEARFLEVQDNFLRDVGIDFDVDFPLTPDRGGYTGAGVGNPGTNIIGSNVLGGAPGTNQLTTSSNLGFNAQIFPTVSIGGNTFVLVCTPGAGCILVPQSLANPVDNLDRKIQTKLLTFDVPGFAGSSVAGSFLNDTQIQLILNAVSASTQNNDILAPPAILYNDQRAAIVVANQQSFVQDFDVEIAQAASIADPLVEVVRDGITLDVRPVVSEDRRFITLELRPTVATLTQVQDNQDTIILPTLSETMVRTSVQIPDGGTVLLGGLKRIGEEQATEGIPWLSKVPFAGFLFRNREEQIQQRNLMVLIKAEIIQTSEAR